MFPTAVEVGLALLTGVASLMLFRWRSHWGVDPRLPLSYFGDELFYANAIFNAQLGDVFTGSSLGGPLGQQLGLSSFGVEWFPSWLASHLGSGAQGPWLAVFRYWQLTYIGTGAASYLALRWIGANRLPSMLGGVAFALIPQHETNSPAIWLVNFSVMPLVVALAVRLVSGLSFADLAPSTWRMSERSASAVGGLLALSCVLVGLTGANYYMIFNLFLLGSAAVFMLARRRWWVRARRLALVTAGALVPLAVCYLPVILTRRSAGLGLSQPSQADRRAFAAYANGGDPFALLAPFKTGVVAKGLSNIAVFRKFFSEYGASTITTGSEYVSFRGGAAVLGALIVLGLGMLGAYRRGDLFRRVSPMSPIVKGVALLGALTVLWYMRGGLGTFLAFVAPQVRGYARASALVTFCSIALLTLAASRGLARSRPLSLLAASLLCLVAVESVSAVVPLHKQPAATGLTIPADTGITTSSGFHVELQTLGPLGAKKLVAAAERQFSPGCTVLVLPLVQYPVDFRMGLPSYYAYEVVKPGLVHSSLRWTSGGIEGTPHNKFTDTWIQRYRNADYDGVFGAADAAHYCGSVFFSSLQQGFNLAGPENGSEYSRDAADVQSALRRRYGPPCYVDQASQVQLYCR